MARRAARSIVLVALATFAVGSGCVCQGQPMRWPAEAVLSVRSPAEVRSEDESAHWVLWVLEWNGETGAAVAGVESVLRCRFHELTERARPKLTSMKFAEPLILASDELVATDQIVVVHSDAPIKHCRWALDRRGPLGLWFGHVYRDADHVVFRTSGLPCEVRRAPE